MRRLSVYLIVSLLIILLSGCNNSTTPQDTSPVTTPAETPASDPYPSLIPPWPDAEVFYDETATINVDLWDKFIIRYDYHSNLFPMFDVTYDRYPNSINLLKEARESTLEPHHGNGVKWFLFQAINGGDTQITIKEFTHQSELVQGQKTFAIKVVKPQ